MVLYQGWVLKGLSLVGVLNKRADSMTLTLYNEKKGEGESKGKMEKDLLKIMVEINLMFLNFWIFIRTSEFIYIQKY